MHSILFFILVMYVGLFIAMLAIQEAHDAADKEDDK